MSKQDFKDGSYGALWIAIAFIFFALLGGGIWGFKVLTSDVKGKGNSVIIKNDARNRIQAQEEYVRLMNEVKRADRQLDILSQMQKDSPLANTRYVGGVSYCMSVVSDYNALGDKYRSADFIPPGYPKVISDLDPTTDCKEN